MRKNRSLIGACEGGRHVRRRHGLTRPTVQLITRCASHHQLSPHQRLPLGFPLFLLIDGLDGCVREAQVTRPHHDDLANIILVVRVAVVVENITTRSVAATYAIKLQGMISNYFAIGRLLLWFE